MWRLANQRSCTNADGFFEEPSPKLVVTKPECAQGSELPWPRCRVSSPCGARTHGGYDSADTKILTDYSRKMPCSSALVTAAVRSATFSLP
jgi:hypothetical protein